MPVIKRNWTCFACPRCILWIEDTWKNGILHSHCCVRAHAKYPCKVPQRKKGNICFSYGIFIFTLLIFSMLLQRFFLKYFPLFCNMNEKGSSKILLVSHLPLNPHDCEEELDFMGLGRKDTQWIMMEYRGNLQYLQHLLHISSSNSISPKVKPVKVCGWLLDITGETQVI